MSMWIKAKIGVRSVLETKYFIQLAIEVLRKWVAQNRSLSDTSVGFYLIRLSD